MHEILIVRMVFFCFFVFNFRKTKDGGTFKEMTGGESN